MKYRTEWLEIKNNDWKIATLKLPTGETTNNVSINRVNKKGEVFPNFDAITLGGEVSGELWVSPAGKAYLFAPRPDKPQGGGKFNATGPVKAMMKEKQEAIRESAENKNEAIKLASSFRMAVDCAIAEYDKSMADDDTLENSIIRWRKKLLQMWDITPKSPVDIDNSPF